LDLTWEEKTEGDNYMTKSFAIDIPSKKLLVIPQQPEVAQGVPGRLRPRIFLTFGTTRVVGRVKHY